MLSSFGAFEDDMEEVVAVERDERERTDENGISNAAYLYCNRFFGVVTRDPKFPQSQCSWSYRKAPKLSLCYLRLS